LPGRQLPARGIPKCRREKVVVKYVIAAAVMRLVHRKSPLTK